MRIRCIAGAYKHYSIKDKNLLILPGKNFSENRESEQYIKIKNLWQRFDFWCMPCGKITYENIVKVCLK